MWHPVGVYHNQSKQGDIFYFLYYQIFSLLSNTFKKLKSIKCRKTSSASCEIHSCHIVHGPEKADFSIHSSVCLHAFEQFLCIMQHLQKSW